MSDIKQVDIKCPKCKSIPRFLIELWRAHTIKWVVIDGKIDRDDGALEPGEPYAVECLCGCGHEWKVRKVQQIDDVLKSEEGGRG
jgi:hypothetical protein